jgi:hypothetical protein
VTNANGTSGPDGNDPTCSVSLDNDGNLYGTTNLGGPNDSVNGGGGMVWKLGSSTTPTAAPTPAISPNGGVYTTAQSVRITDSLAWAAIYYTTDGSTPTTSSSQYNGPITVSSSKTVTVIAVATGYATSAPASAVFTIDASAIASFSAGLQMISLPYTYTGTSLDTLFGYSGVTLAVWDQGSDAYALTPTPPANQISLGQGYWVRFPQVVTIDTAGTPAPTNAPFDIPLQAGWNMIGDPFATSVAISSLTFNNGTETFAQATGSSTPLVGSTVWTYGAGSSAYTSATSLAPDAGYWVFAYSATDVEVSE